MGGLSEKARAFSVDSILNADRKKFITLDDRIDQFDNKWTSGLLQDSLKAQLCSQELWNEFHRLGTEMIITKAGSRRMFPAVTVKLSGLDKNKKYVVFMDIVPVENKRYRYIYHSSEWVAAGSGEVPPTSRLYIHPDSPISGHLLMTKGGILSFDKLKLTNNSHPVINGQITLSSMHKYIPRVHVISDWKNEGNCNLKSLNIDDAVTFTFPETSFVTVTAYQNHQITQLKIASNPFAKGFRLNAKQREIIHGDTKHCSKDVLIPTLV